MWRGAADYSSDSATYIAFKEPFPYASPGLLAASQHGSQPPVSYNSLMLLSNTGSPFPTQNSCTELQGSRRAQPPERWRSLTGSEGIQVFIKAGLSLRNQTKNTYFYANSLANKRQLLLEIPWWESQEPTGSKIQIILVSCLKKRELQELNIVWRCLFSHATKAGVDELLSVRFV